MHNDLKGTSMMKVLCIRAAHCDSGATAMENALIAAIISVALLTGADTLGTALSDKFTSLSKTVDVASQVQARSGGGTKLVSSQSAAKGQVLIISCRSPETQGGCKTLNSGKTRLY